MKSIGKPRRLLFILATVIVLVGVLVSTQLATTPVKAQLTTQDVIIFHCSVIPSQPITALGFSNYTQSANAPNVNPSSCAQVMADVLNAGFRLKSALVLPNGGLSGTGATEYVFVRGTNQ